MLPAKAVFTACFVVHLCGVSGQLPSDLVVKLLSKGKLKNASVWLEEIRNFTQMDRQKLADIFRLAGVQQIGQTLLEHLSTVNDSLAAVRLPAVLSAQCMSDLLYLAKNIKQTAAAVDEDEDKSTDAWLMQSDNPMDAITWSLKVIDSFGKVPTGLLHGNVWMLGSYEQCVGISVAKEAEGVLWQGQYCRYDVKLFQRVLRPSLRNSEIGSKCYDALPLKYGACVPASCSMHDVRLLGQIVNKSVGGIACDVKITCHGRRDVHCEAEVGPVATALISLFMVLVVALLIFGTAYDWFVVRSQKTLPRLVSATCLLQQDEKLDSGKYRNAKTEGQAANSEPSLFVRVILAFSVYSNGKRLLSMAPPKRLSHQITCFHGIRVLSMFWIVFGHTYYWAIGYLNNLVDAYKLPDNVFNQVLLNGSLAVDSFLFLGASLLSFIWLKKMKQNEEQTKSPLFWLRFILHKYLRVTPVYLAVLVFYAVLLPKLGEGPMWNRCNFNNDACEQSWWTNVLYLNNFFNLNNPCMTWTWYLALDMQFFMLALPLLVLFLRREVVAVAVSLLLLCSSVAVQIAYRVQNPDWPPIAIFSVNQKQFDIIDIYWRTIYVKPYTRSGPFIVGLLFGYYMHKVKLSKQMSRRAVITAWLCFTGAAIGVLFGLCEYSKNYRISYVAMLIYAGFGRIVWALVLAWISFACTTGHGGPVNDFLSWKVWQPLSRLTYCLYLVHPILIQAYYASQAKPLHFSGHYQMVHLYFGHLFVSIFIALITCLSFEWPVQILEPIVFEHPKRSKSIVR